MLQVPLPPSHITLVGILNVTPDSYVDGGRFASMEKALERTKRMVEDGVDIVEIGGESSGPHSCDVSLVEEERRVLPVIEALRSHFPDLRLSLDTTKSALADKALTLGVTMINDITAGRSDAQMFPVCARHGASLVLMYSKNASARTTIEHKSYTNIMATIRSFFEERIEASLRSGIVHEHLIIDPGLGHFLSADPRYSFEVLHNLSRLTDLAPVFISPSRKSFLAGPKQLPPDLRLPATLAATAIAVRNGASFIRTHDVFETKEVLRVLAQ